MRAAEVPILLELFLNELAATRHGTAHAVKSDTEAPLSPSKGVVVPVFGGASGRPDGFNRVGGGDVVACRWQCCREPADYVRRR